MSLAPLAAVDCHQSSLSFNQAAGFGIVHLLKATLIAVGIASKLGHFFQKRIYARFQAIGRNVFV